MRVFVCLPLVLLSVVIAATFAFHDHQPLRQPTLYESECAKQWTKRSTRSSDASSDDPSTGVSRTTGELRVKLSVQLKRFTSDYVDFNTRTFNGLVPAPTIKVCPGDRLLVILTNLLEAGESNNTNVHLHGMHVSPMADADNVLPIVKPGGQRRYSYDIRRDHPAGTFWYHPHAHGNVNSQLNGMMAGALIVVDRPVDFPLELAAMDDCIMILQAICVEDCFNMHDNLQDALENAFDFAANVSKDLETRNEARVWPTNLEIAQSNAHIPLNDTSLPTVYVNGQYMPSMDLLVRQYKRLRFVNAIANNVVELVTTRGSSCRLNVLAMDGIYFDKPKAKQVLVIPPGGRADVAIMCAEIGEFYLEIECASSRNKLLGLVNQHRIPSQRIVKLKVRDEEEASDDGEIPSEATRLPSMLPKRPAYMETTIGTAHEASDIAESNTYDFEFSVWMDKGIKYGVNHEEFNLANINYSMPVNELQQWRLSVRDYRKSAMPSCDLDDVSSLERRLIASSHCHTMSHPFHIHSTHFQVSDVDDDADPDGIMFDVGEWRDTLPLFRGAVQIRFTPRQDMVGNIFAHCHVASHADAGMAQFVSVYDPSARPNRDEEEDSSADSEDDADTDEDEDEEDDDDDDEVDESDNDEE